MMHLRPRTWIGWGALLIMLAGALSPEAAAQDATPVAETSATGMGGMLARVPAAMPELDEPHEAFISYANIELQLATVGVEAPTDPEANLDEWAGATVGLAMPSTAANFLKRWRETYGFDLLQARETLEIAHPPFNLTLYRGDFDEDTIRTKLDELGYTPFDVDGVEAFNLRGDFEMDMQEDPIRGVFASMNNAVILPDGTLAFAPARSVIEAVVGVANGDLPSLADRVDIEALLPHLPDDLVSGTLLSGLMLAGAGMVDIDLSGPVGTPVVVEETSEPLPPIITAILGSTAGGPIGIGRDAAATPQPAGVPDARAVAALLFLTPDGAADAAPIIEERIETWTSQRTQQPYSDFFSDFSATAAPGERVVTIDLTLAETRSGILLQMLATRDLLFLAW